MKKKTLKLRRETLQDLSSDHLQDAEGAVRLSVGACISILRYCDPTFGEGESCILCPCPSCTC